jgi:small neutral amino acid transporter SnatA (MarC family)
MAKDFIQTLILLILVTDPFGNVPIFVSALAHVPPQRRWRVIVRECAIAFGLLLLFMFFGKAFLNLMQLSEVSIRIGGGVILFLIALRMVFPQEGGVFGDAKTIPNPSSCRSPFQRWLVRLRWQRSCCSLLTAHRK